MFEFSSKTLVNKKFRLTELYKLIQADKAIKEDAKVVLSISLSNVLSNETLNFSTKGTVKEIYVFDLVLSEKRIPMLFISALDKAINLHTVFVLHFDNKKMLYGAYKEKVEKGVKVGKYYSTDWLNESEKQTLPLEVSCLDDIYTAIIDVLIPIEARQNETTADFVARYEEIGKLQKEIDILQKQVDCEKQSKKRFELNAMLKSLQQELKVLLGKGVK